MLLPAVARSASVELLLGGALNASSDLRIEQHGLPAIDIDADYETRPFEFPVYYALRVAQADERGAWELQFIHHKVHLTNTTREVERFEITDGFNIFTLNRAVRVGSFDLRAGAGTVLAHADSSVRGESAGDRGILDSGYEFAGPAVVAGVGRRFRLSQRWTALVETQVSAARVRVSVAGGSAATTNIAFHLLLGLGYTW
jgi:hypothetical protein